MFAFGGVEVMGRGALMDLGISSRVFRYLFFRDDFSGFEVRLWRGIEGHDLRIDFFLKVF